MECMQSVAAQSISELYHAFLFQVHMLHDCLCYTCFATPALHALSRPLWLVLPRSRPQCCLRLTIEVRLVPPSRLSRTALGSSVPCPTLSYVHAVLPPQQSQSPGPNGPVPWRMPHSPYSEVAVTFHGGDNLIGYAWGDTRSGVGLEDGAHYYSILFWLRVMGSGD